MRVRGGGVEEGSRKKKGLTIRKVLTAAVLLCAAQLKAHPSHPSIDREVVCLLSGVLKSLRFTVQ